MDPPEQMMREQYEKVVDPVLSAVRRDCGAIIATLHKFDFGKSGPAVGGGGASVYMEELTAKLNFVKQEILERYAGMEVVRQWCVLWLSHGCRMTAHSSAVISRISIA